MSLIDRLSGRKAGSNGTAPASPAVVDTPESRGAPIAPAAPPAVPAPRQSPLPSTPVTAPSARLASSMYTSRAQRGDPDKLSAVDQLKIDLHHRLIERLDLEALEQIKDELEVVH